MDPVKALVILLASATLTALPALAKGTTSVCSIAQVCETGAACTRLAAPMILQLSETGNRAELLQEVDGATFALRAVSGTPDGLRSYAGSGDRGRAAVLLTIWDDGAIHLATLDLTTSTNLPAVLIGTCEGAGS